MNTQNEVPGDDKHAFDEWVDSVADRFDAAWQNNPPASIEHFIGDTTARQRIALLHELIKIDMEYRWREGKPISLENYAEQFPELRDSDGTIDDELVRHEVRIGREFSSPQVVAPPFPSLPEEDAARIACPHCGNVIQLALPKNQTASCDVCGSTFRLKLSGNKSSASDVPKIIGKFQLLEVLGRGGFGTVYKARDAELGRTVAVKVPRSGYFDSQEQQQRFLREATSASQLQHPGIVKIHEIGHIDDLPFLVSEYIEGKTLADHITSTPPDFREAAKLTAQIADALHYAHQNGVVHRDIKPANILLDLAGEPHLADFGLARHDEPEVTITLEGQILGTPAYMSPEQAAGNSQSVDRRSDVYSLGTVLYRMLTGELPFEGNIQSLLKQLAEDEPPAPRKINRRIPKPLEKVCLRATAKDPRQRYENAGEFAEDLRRFLAGEPVRARMAVSFQQTGKKTANVVFAFLLLLVSGMVGLAALGFLCFALDLAVRSHYRELPLRVGGFFMMTAIALVPFQAGLRFLRPRRRRRPLLEILTVVCVLGFISASLCPAVFPRYFVEDNETAKQALTRRGVLLSVKGGRVDRVICSMAWKVTDHDLVYLKGLPHVTELDASGTEITNTGLAHLQALKNLRELDLSGTAVTDAGLHHLTELTSLKLLQLEGTSVSDDGLQTLRKALPACKIIIRQ